jgi:hypothetical protein
MYFHAHGIILIKIKFDIDINNDELLKTIWKQIFFNKNWLSLVVHSNVKFKFDYI